MIKAGWPGSYRLTLTREAGLFKPFEGKVKQQRPQKVPPAAGDCKTFLRARLNARRKSVSRDLLVPMQN